MAQNYVDEMTINGVSHEIQDTEARERIALLEEAYQGLTQSDIIIVDGDLPVSGQEKNKIYRKTGTNSYTDYMWDGTQFVPMATYNNAVDTTFDPTSDNLASEKATANYLAEKLAKKANINGTYLAMCVGMAKNVEAQSELSGTFLFRPTAGENEVADGPAKVCSIKGNSVAWGQIRPYGFSVGSAHGVTFTNDNGVVVANGTATDMSYVEFSNVNFIEGHKYLLRGTPSGGSSNTYYTNSPKIGGTDFGNGFIGTAGSSQYNFIRIYIQQGIVATNMRFGIVLFDLTLMFGAGNEPATPEAFEAWLQANVGLQTYYPYNAGELLSAKMLGIKTVGTNQWDEQWRNDGVWNNNGIWQSVANQYLSSRNMIPVIGNTSYYHNFPKNGFIRYYNSNGDYIGSLTTSSPQAVFTTPVNAAYINFSLYFGSQVTYNNDICINLHYTNGRDGEYEPYEEHNYDFDVTKVYGKLNGEGNLVQVFSNGMRSAGTVHDVIDITKREAVCSTGSKIFDNNNAWGKASDGVFYSSVNSSMKSWSNNINNKYIAGAPGDSVAASNGTDKTLRCGSDKRYILKDTSCADIEAVKTAMSGVEIIYELAEPLVYTDLVYRDNGVDTPIDALNIQVSNYGTEEQIVESPTDGEPNSCAATLDTLYGLNASDFMDAANNGAFISKASMDAFLSALGAAMGGTWSQTWNDSTGHYDYAFTATPQVENQE